MTDAADEDPTAIAVAALIHLDHPLKTATSEWASANLAQGDTVAADRDCAFSEADWKRAADYGLQGLLIDPAYGGGGRDIASALLILEGLGHGCRDNGLSYGLASQILSHQVAVERFASEEQKQRWLPGLCDGSVIGAFATTEPGSGSDTTAIQTRAVATDDGWLLNGHKAYITLAPRADVILVFASTNPDAGGWGVSAFLVASDTPGVELLPNRAKMGMRTTPFGDIRLNDVAVGADSLVGRAGAGFSMFSSAMEAERAFVLATQVGAMERAIDEAVQFAKDREQGGAPIGNYQAVAHRIADMKARHEAARALLYKSALQVLAGKNATMAAAITKLSVSESSIETMLDAVRVQGARGYTSEFGVERELRDAVAGVIYSGTSDIQRNIIARLLGLGSG